MYRSHHFKIIAILVFGFLVPFCISSHVMGFDLLGQITSKFQNYSKKDFSDENFSNVYSSRFPGDPFNDAMANIENRSMQLKLAGVEYIENLLGKEGCDLSQKEILGILYYYVPEFRAELVESLKQEMGDYDNEKYMISNGRVGEFCVKYYLCKNDSNSNSITSSSPANIESYCKEKFQNYYKEGQDNKRILQQIEVAQIGVDKYWNNSTEDSPYDIMSDLGMFSKLLYYGVENPITPVVYNIPMFSNSKKKLEERKNSESLLADISLHGGNVGENSSLDLVAADRGYNDLGDGGDGVSLLGGNTKKNQISEGGTLTEIKGLPLTYDKDGYDDLVEGLNSLKLGNDNLNFYTSLCRDSDEELESEQEEIMKEDKGLTGGDFSNLSDKEYQEIIDYMLDAVDDYSALPNGKEKEIQNNIGDINSIVDATTSSELEAAADKIKNCWKSCEGLRVDQKASCMLKCACGEVKSPIFNPEKTPGLGPIFLIRFCAVPAVNTNFSVGGKRIYSIEEGLSEIYGVVDKLSREGKLGKWTQQYEFLDSSTKKINIADTFAFSIDIDFVDIINKRATHSDQYKKKDLDVFNEKALKVYGVSNPLNDPSAKNVYRIDGEGSEGLKMLVDLIEDSNAYRYGEDEETIEQWMDQQAQLWQKIYNGILDYTNYSEKLYMKKG